MDNVLFGQPFEEDRYWRVIEDLYLLPDLQLLADEDLTEVRCMLGSNVLIFPSADFLLYSRCACGLIHDK
jgi:hypothetical protein